MLCVKFSKTGEESVTLNSVKVGVKEFLSLVEDFLLNLVLVGDNVKDASGEDFHMVALDDEGDAGFLNTRGEGVDDLKASVNKGLF